VRNAQKELCAFKSNLLTIFQTTKKKQTKGKISRGSVFAKKCGRKGLSRIVRKKPGVTGGPGGGGSA